MGLFLCDLCNQQLDKNHECDKQKLLDHINYLKEAETKSHLQINKIRDSILFLLHDIPTLNSDKVEVKTELIRKLYESAGPILDDKYNTAESYLVVWIAMHQILSSAFDLFRTRNKSNLYTKLSRLKEVCLHAKEVLKYKDTQLPLSPEDLIEEVKQLKE